jgi:TfoX/Sxy family transcriptional regulator of competence genes
MPSERDLLDRVESIMAGIDDVERKRMFGSLGFMIGGRLALSVRPDRLMLRIDPDLHDDAVARDGVSTVHMRGREYRGWVWVDATVVVGEADLRHWVDLALDFNARAE